MSGKLTDDGAAFWLAMDGWTAEEAAFLLHAIDPRYGHISIGKAGIACVDPMLLSDASDMIARAFEAGALRSPANPADVIAWAKSKGLRLPRQFLEAQVGDNEKATPATGGAGTVNRTEDRIAAIVKTAQQFGYNPMSVPHGGKAAIERECLDKLAADPCRFTPDTFKSAWQKARDAGRVDVENAKVYRGQ